MNTNFDYTYCIFIDEEIDVNKNGEFIINNPDDMFLFSFQSNRTYKYISNKQALKINYKGTTITLGDKDFIFNVIKEGKDEEYGRIIISYINYPFTSFNDITLYQEEEIGFSKNSGKFFIYDIEISSLSS